MTNKTITFKCDICGRKLTFYRDSFAYSGASCPICDPLGYKPILIPTKLNVLFGKRAVLKTRELYVKQSKNSSKITLDEVIDSKRWF